MLSFIKTKITQAAILTAALSVMPAFANAAENNAPADDARILTAASTAYGKTLAQLEKKLSAYDPSVKIVFLDADEIVTDALMNMKGPRTDETDEAALTTATKKFLEKRGVHLKSDTVETLSQSLGNYIPVSMLLQRAEGSLLPETKSDKVCVVTPAQPDIAQKDLVALQLQLVSGEKPYGDVVVNISHRPGELHYQMNGHEGARCFSPYGSQISKLGPEEWNSPAGLLLRLKEEIFSDLVSASEAVLAGYDDNLTHTADVRNTAVYFLGPHAAKNKGMEMRESHPETSWTSFSLNYLERELRKVGLAQYAAMTLAQRAKAIHNIVEETAPTEEQLKHLRLFYGKGPDYMHAVSAPIMAFLSRHVADARMPLNLVLARVSPDVARVQRQAHIPPAGAVYAQEAPDVKKAIEDRAAALAPQFGDSRTAFAFARAQYMDEQRNNLDKQFVPPPVRMDETFDDVRTREVGHAQRIQDYKDSIRARLDIAQAMAEDIKGGPAGP